MIQGQIWARDLQSIGSIANQVTSDSGGYRSPIFLSGGRYLLALKGEMVVKVRVSNGSVETLFPIKGIEKLVGLRKTADEQAGDQVLVLIGQGGDSCPIIGILSVKNKDVTPIPYVPYTGGDDDMLLIDHLRGWTREYDGGNFLLQVQDLVNCTGPDKAPTTNICFQEKGKPWRQVTDCSPANCGQPSLSNDRTKMVYIKDG
jgi:hypothetical protein